jgi:hypothetical protein
MSYSKLFRDNAGKVITAVMSDGEKISGKLNGYISAVDNDPDPECIIINNTELYTNEIADVSVAK